MFGKIASSMRSAAGTARGAARTAGGYMPQARNVASGFGAGIRGQVGRMPSQMFAGGYRAGAAMRSPMGGAAAGAAMGGMYGAGSDNTSILGGALMGAGIGAGAAFGGTRMQGAMKAGKGATMSSNIGGALGSLANQARLGFQGARMSANQGFNSFKARAGGR